MQEQDAPGQERQLSLTFFEGKTISDRCPACGGTPESDTPWREMDLLDHLINGHDFSYKKVGETLGCVQGTIGKWTTKLKLSDPELYKTSTKELVEDFHRVAKLDHTSNPPTQPEYTIYGEYGVSMVEERHENWNSFLVEYGYTPNLWRDVPDERIISDFDKVANLDHTHETPYQEEYCKYGTFSPNIIINRWDSWNEFLRQNGYSPNRQTDSTRDDVAADYIRVSELPHITPPPTASEYFDEGHYSRSLIEKYFGTVNGINEELGLGRNQWGTTTRSEVIKNFEYVHSLEATQDPPIRTEFLEYSDCDTKPIYRIWDGWNDFLESQGYHGHYIRHVPNLSSALRVVRRTVYKALKPRFDESGPRVRESAEDCYNCGDQPLKSLNSHHIVPALWGGSNQDELLLPLCKECHMNADTYMRRNLSEFATIPKLVREEERRIENNEVIDEPDPTPSPTDDGENFALSSFASGD